LPRTARNKNAILVIVEKLTRYAYFLACDITITAAQVATMLDDRITRNHGFVQKIICDRDPRMASTVFQEYCALRGIRTNMSTAFHPQSDGQTERMNRELEDYLRHFVSHTQKDWDTYLPMAQLAINDSYSATLKASPQVLMYGMHALTPANVRVQLMRNKYLKKKDPESPVPVEHMTDVLFEKLRIAKECRQAASNRQKAYADSHRKEVEFAVGDKLLLNSKNLTLYGCRKLMPRFVGPFEVTHRVGPVAYTLKLPEDWKVHPTFHVSLLRKHSEDSEQSHPPLPQWVGDGFQGAEIECIADTRIYKVKDSGTERRQYLVRWQGYPKEYDTWEPEERLLGNDKVLTAFWEMYNSHAQRLEALKAVAEPRVTRAGKHKIQQSEDQARATKKPRTRSGK